MRRIMRAANVSCQWELCRARVDWLSLSGQVISVMPCSLSAGLRLQEFWH